MTVGGRGVAAVPALRHNVGEGAGSIVVAPNVRPVVVSSVWSMTKRPTCTDVRVPAHACRYSVCNILQVVFRRCIHLVVLLLLLLNGSPTWIRCMQLPSHSIGTGRSAACTSGSTSHSCSAASVLPCACTTPPSCRHSRRLPPAGSSCGKLAVSSASAGGDSCGSRCSSALNNLRDGMQT